MKNCSNEIRTRRGSPVVWFICSLKKMISIEATYTPIIFFIFRGLNFKSENRNSTTFGTLVKHMNLYKRSHDSGSTTKIYMLIHKWFDPIMTCCFCDLFLRWSVELPFINIRGWNICYYCTCASCSNVLCSFLSYVKWRIAFFLLA